MAKQKINFLDLIPVRSDKNEWRMTDDTVTILMEHRGFYPWIAQRFFKKPRVSQIDLDTFGSFIWQQINGSRTVGDIALLLKNQFGDAVEPLYDRLIEYMKILKNNRFITFR